MVNALFNYLAVSNLTSTDVGFGAFGTVMIMGLISYMTSLPFGLILPITTPIVLLTIINAMVWYAFGVIFDRYYNTKAKWPLIILLSVLVFAFILFIAANIYFINHK